MINQNSNKWVWRLHEKQWDKQLENSRRFKGLCLVSKKRSSYHWPSSSSYRNHLFLWIAIYYTLPESSCADLIVLQSIFRLWRKVARVKLQVTLQQSWRQSLQSNTDVAPKKLKVFSAKKLKVFSAKIWYDANFTCSEFEIINDRPAWKLVRHNRCIIWLMQIIDCLYKAL